MPVKLRLSRDLFAERSRNLRYCRAIVAELHGNLMVMDSRGSKELVSQKNEDFGLYIKHMDTRSGILILFDF
ncbi:MAG: hypothetical protein AAGA77_17405 [Bacteroidota bacterium]